MAAALRQLGLSIAEKEAAERFAVQGELRAVAADDSAVPRLDGGNAGTGALPGRARACVVPVVVDGNERCDNARSAISPTPAPPGQIDCPTGVRL
jgi:hypothetical protein